MAEIFIKVALFCLGLCISTLILAGLFEKMGVKFHDKFAGKVFVASFVVGTASALVGMLLSL